MLIRASKCVAVGNNARHRVVPVDGKGVVQPGADGLHTRIDDAVLDDVDTADALDPAADSVAALLVAARLAQVDMVEGQPDVRAAGIATDRWAKK